MTDPRVIKLAKIIVDDAAQVKKGERVQISATDIARELVMEVYKLVIKRGGYPMVNIGLRGMSKIFYENASEERGLVSGPECHFSRSRGTTGYLPFDFCLLSTMHPGGHIETWTFLP